MAVFNKILVLVVFCQILLGEGQQVYIGTGLNGTTNYEPGNDIVVLGGLLPIYSTLKDEKCTEIINPSIQRVEAIALTTQKINDDPNFLPGVTLRFEIRETCTETNHALEQSLNFVTGTSLVVNETVLGVTGVVGATISDVSINVARLLRLFKVPQISFASTAETLSDTTTFDYFFRTVPPDSLQARTMADIVDYFNWTYVIAMYSDNTYGSDGIDGFEAELTKLNSTEICIASKIEVKVGTDTTTDDYDNVVEELNQEWTRNSSVVVLFADLATATRVLEAVQRKRMIDPEFASRNLTWIGGDAYGDRVPEELYETAQGLLGVIPQTFLSEEFDRHFQSLNPLNNTDNPWFGEYWEKVFNCSLESPSPAGSEECDIQNQAISSETGYQQSAKVTLAIDAVYAFAHAIHNMQQDFCGGGPGLCSEILDTRSGGVVVKGELLRQYLYNVSFAGNSTEVINFDSNGDQRGTYVVKNLQRKSDGEFVYEDIGDWDEERSSPLQIFGDIQWSHGRSDSIPVSVCSYPCGNGQYPEDIADEAECCWVCRDCPGDNSVSTGLLCTDCPRGYAPNAMKTECVFIQPSYLTWSHAWSIVIIILTIFGIIATSAVAIVFIVYYRHKLIKASSRELSAVLLTGIMLCYLLPFFFIAMPSPWTCAIHRFGVGFCFAMCYSALLVKTNRIHRIFNRSPDTLQAPILISPQSQLFFTAGLVAIQVVIAVVWLIVERPNVKYVYKTGSTELTCNENPYIGLSITLAYNFLLLGITTYFAFRTRNVPQNFNEAKYISFTMYTLCILWLAFIPTYFATTYLLGTEYQTGSLMLVIILNASITLGFLFGPKVYYVFFGKEKEIRSETFMLKNLNEKCGPIPMVNTSSLPTVLGGRTTSNVSDTKESSITDLKSGGIDTKPHADGAAIQVNGKPLCNFADATTQT